LAAGDSGYVDLGDFAGSADDYFSNLDPSTGQVDFSSGPIYNTPGISASPSFPASNGNGGIGGILNGIASIVSAGAKFVAPSGTVPRTLYRPLPSSSVGAQLGGSSNMLLLFAIGAAALFFLKKKAA
jgi:hypothetical protein